jgi:hypothetical protein
MYLDTFYLKSQNLSEKFVGRVTVNYNILRELNSEISRYIVGLVTLNILNLLSDASPSSIRTFCRVSYFDYFRLFRTAV